MGIKWLASAVVGFVAVLAGGYAHAQIEIYSGVQTCANSQCHGAATVNPDSRVNRNEFTVWHNKTRHSKAYDSLTTPRAQRIAANLGIVEATSADLCLSCHANNVPVSQQAPDFDITEGVTCEVCHGSSVEWLGPHRLSQQYSHADLVERGLFPTNDPVKRADMCLDCHFGAQDQFVSHRIYGAGHPRLSFELDSYSWIGAHYNIDRDYYERKTVADGVKTWAVGAAKMVERRMVLLADDKTGTNGFFPEFAFFDCNTCHHRMSELRYQPRETGLPPGTPKLDDSHMTVLKVALERSNPALGEQLQAAVLELHQSSAQGRPQLVAAATRVGALAGEAALAIAAHDLSGDDMRAVLGALVEAGSSGRLFDFAAAEQATLVIGATIDAMEKTGHITASQGQSMFSELNKAYDAVQNDEKFRPEQFVSAMKSLRAVIR
ncbi:MAG: multiheme c-type cytochrome [Pseudomonadota bacterium]